MTFERMSEGINSDVSIDPYGSILETMRQESITLDQYEKVMRKL